MRLRGQYKVIVCDPFRGTVSLPKIPLAATPLELAGAKDSIMLLWAGLGGAGLLNGTALYCLEHWGYTPQVIHTWEHTGAEGYGLPKLTGAGLATSELCILATKGSPALRGLGLPPNLSSVHYWRAPANPYHKPEGFYRWIEEQLGGPYLAVFTNPLRGNWDTYQLREEPDAAL